MKLASSISSAWNALCIYASLFGILCMHNESTMQQIDCLCYKWEFLRILMDWLCVLSAKMWPECLMAAVVGLSASTRQLTRLEILHKPEQRKHDRWLHNSYYWPCALLLHSWRTLREQSSTQSCQCGQNWSWNNSLCSSLISWSAENETFIKKKDFLVRVS